MLTLHVNGQTQTFDGDPSMPLLWYLRDVLGLTGTKFGCGVAACGACAIHLDGDAVRSCVTAISDANGKSITTIEGLDPEGLARAQCAAVRLLSGGPDHASRGASETDAPSHGRRHQHHDVWQHLPLWDLSAHSRRDQASCGSVT
jgi:2Fe-2S iron-sulfur cluster binding domain